PGGIATGYQPGPRPVLMQAAHHPGGIATGYQPAPRPGLMQAAHHPGGIATGSRPPPPSRWRRRPPPCRDRNRPSGRPRASPSPRRRADRAARPGCPHTAGTPPISLEGSHPPPAARTPRAGAVPLITLEGPQRDVLLRRPDGLVPLITLEGSQPERLDPIGLALLAAPLITLEGSQQHHRERLAGRRRPPLTSGGAELVGQA